jgi:TRAP-type C4-dicarboxylate transport system permease small subunit
MYKKNFSYEKITKNITESFGVFIFLLIIALQTYNIFSRYTKIGRPFMWVEELTRYIFIWIVFLFWHLNDRENSHFVVDLLPNKLSGAKRKSIDLCIKAAGLSFAAVVIWFSIKYIPTTMIYCTDSFRQVPQGIVYMIIPLGLLLVFIEKIRMIVKDLQNKGYKEPDS